MRELLRLAVVIAIVGGAGLGFLLLEGKKGHGLKAGDAAPPLRLPALTGEWDTPAALDHLRVLLGGAAAR